MTRYRHRLGCICGIIGTTRASAVTEDGSVYACSCVVCGENKSSDRYISTQHMYPNARLRRCNWNGQSRTICTMVRTNAKIEHSHQFGGMLLFVRDAACAMPITPTDDDNDDNKDDERRQCGYRQLSASFRYPLPVMSGKCTNTYVLDGSVLAPIRQTIFIVSVVCVGICLTF